MGYFESLIQNPQNRVKQGSALYITLFNVTPVSELFSKYRIIVTKIFVFCENVQFSLEIEAWRRT